MDREDGRVPAEEKVMDERAEKEKVARAIMALEGFADAWAAEINLPILIENISSPARLAPHAPDDVRTRFIGRMKDQMSALVLQAFAEGMYRGRIAPFPQSATARKLAAFIFTGHGRPWDQPRYEDLKREARAAGLLEEGR